MSDVRQGIVRIGLLYFFMTYPPARHSQVTRLILPEARSATAGIRPALARGSADILFFGDRPCFALLIQPQFEVTEEAQDRFIEDVLRYAWDGLVGFDLASGEMPRLIEGDLRKML
ncbi:MAG TPA: hypothetical protein VLA77_00210 [Candidatus Saccharimonadales bacterium]|nr:hypothetical protein [Candidatus Saccharimonadales bacterium]